MLVLRQTQVGAYVWAMCLAHANDCPAINLNRHTAALTPGKRVAFLIHGASSVVRGRRLYRGIGPTSVEGDSAERAVPRVAVRVTVHVQPVTVHLSAINSFSYASDNPLKGLFRARVMAPNTITRQDVGIASIDSIEGGGRDRLSTLEMLLTAAETSSQAVGSEILDLNGLKDWLEAHDPHARCDLYASVTL